MSQKIINLKKKIKYRLLYSGTKETDILYKKLITEKLDSLNFEELLFLSELFIKISDLEIFNILTGKSKSKSKYQDFFNIIKKTN